MKSSVPQMLSLIVLISILMTSSGHSLVILSDNLGDLRALSVMNISRYSKKLCIDCTNRSILPRAWNGVRSFTESEFAYITKGEGYLLNPNDMLRRMHALLKVLKKAADPDDGVYELTLIREIISNHEFLTLDFIDQITERAKDAMTLELDTKVRLFEKNGVAPSDAEIFRAICKPGKEYEACKTKNLALIFLNRFFTQIIEQFSIGAKFGQPGATLYSAMQERLKVLETAHAPKK